MNRARSGLLVSTLLAGLALALGCAAKPRLGDPLPGLPPELRQQFDRGRAVFDREFAPRDGLGPLFNADACGECHEDPISGGVGDEVEIHATATPPDGGTCDHLIDAGGPVIQQSATPELQAAIGIEREPTPARATALGRRTTPDLFGFGLLDTITDEEILSRADPDDRDRDGISGRPNRFFDGRLGRFGRKAHTPTLREFNDGAFVAEQGITSPAVPTEETIGGEPIPDGVDLAPDPEIDQAALDSVDAFVRFLAPPSPRDLDGPARSGRKLFRRIGCDACHVPVLRTGRHPMKALSREEVAAYTDLLLHDMGPTLADICLGLAAPAEFRTEPLMGLRLSQVFLHDGRAATIEEAIRLHGGESAASRDRFTSLSAADREALLRFLGSL